MTRGALFVLTFALLAGMALWLTREPPAPVPVVPPFASVTIDGVSVPLAKLEAVYPHVVDSDMFRFDPVAIVRAQPNQTRVQPWNEHPRGEIVVQTNNLGLRSDTPTVEPTGRRVLVVGDSHTYGLVNIEECLHSLLEKQLEEHFGEPFEVLNAAIGGIGPYEYVGAVESFLSLKPEAVVVVVYTGNDFTNALDVSNLVAGRVPSGPPADAKKRLDDVREHWSRKRCLGQGINQAFRFKHDPTAETLAVDATVHCVEQIATRCAEDGVSCLVTMLPTKMDVEPHDEKPLLDAVLEALDVTRADSAIHRRMGRAVLDKLAARGIAGVDPFEAMVAHDDLLFWRGDHHLAVRGQEVLAAALMPALVQALSQSSASLRREPRGR